MRVAIIDLGTNSVRFDVHQIGPGGRIRQLHREKLMIRLGQGVFLNGKLDPTAIRRTLQAFSSFKRTATELQAEKIVSFGTSALREASDSERLLNQIRERTGIDVRVISGGEEAKLIAEGFLENQVNVKGRYALVDIGGGSAEINVCQGKNLLFSESFPLGTARLQQVFLKSSPPRLTGRGEISPIDQLRRYIKSIILPKFIAESWPKVDRIYGSSGTIRAVSKILKKSGGGRAIEFADLSSLISEMSGMTTTELLGVPGMESKRVDMILAGAILLEEIMIALKAKKTLPTDYSLRDGILREEVRLFQQHRGSHLAFHFQDLYSKAQRLGMNMGHVKQVVKLSEELFDRLRPVHRLKNDWKPYLTAAAILHDTGEAVSPTRHEVHSYYIVKNAEFPAMEKWETEFVAQLCLRHRGGKVSVKDLSFGNEKNRRIAFVKLLSILRIADALDRGHQTQVRIKSVQTAGKTVKIRISGRSAVDLELLRVDQKKTLFEQTFGKGLVVERTR